MKYIVVVISILLLSMTVSAYAVIVSIDSSIEVQNPPLKSKWKTECGTSAGVYTEIKQFNMVEGVINRIYVSDIFPSTGNWFCRTSFVQIYVQGPFSAEIPVTVTVPVLSVPQLVIIP